MSYPDDEGGDCTCAHEFAQEAHDTAAALAERHQIDLCDGPPDEDEPEAVEDLRIIHDLAVAHGAECPEDDLDGLDDGDEEDDAGPDEDEPDDGYAYGRVKKKT